MAHRRQTSRALILTLYLVLVAGLSGAIGWVALGDGLNRLTERARADLSLASDRLTGQLARFRQLGALLADHPTLKPLVLTGRGDRAAAERLLLAAADRSGSDDILLLGPDGRVLARAHDHPGAPVSYADAGYFRRALQGATGFHHGLEGSPPRRIFTYAVPVFPHGGPAAGAVVLRVDAERVEANWRGAAQTVYFTDALGVVFVSNRDELLYGRGAPAAPSRAARDLTYPAGLTTGLPAHDSWSVGGHELWWLAGGRYLPRLALHLTRPLPVVEMQGNILIDAGPALRMAGLQAAVAAALCLIFGAVLFAVTERRRALALQLETEARAKAELEDRVAARTRELSDAVTRLREEVIERQEAEAALKKAQQDLIQAGKLSALGQMSAGISHELNQPLMAIRSFAENGAAFIDRGRPEAAAANLGRISDLARRMGRIIKNLRAFARQEVEAIADVDLGAVIAAVLEMIEARIRRDGVSLHYAPPDGPVWVRGGEVRLQQVVLNLVSNALDAMQAAPTRRLELTLEPAGDRVRLRVRDSGPGIADPERIFDPFYSTKEVGASEGMGLGLSISYGIVNSFGGSISGCNRPEGGAEFTIELAASTESEAA
ncbi:sensor histidine kinase [Acidimangrovimonas pyrenivorans]|uniref:histidine kinase n=1 Tax=Acidimangrovimonas pyrenivorans TaxID=2030798 RepID=A0ABV7AF74_9RHOB